MADEAAALTNVLLEDIQMQLRMIADGLISVREAVERRFEERYIGIEQRIAILEGAVRINGADIFQLKADVKKFKTFVGQVKAGAKQLGANAVAVDRHMASFEARIAAIEAQLSARTPTVPARKTRRAKRH